MSEFSHLKNKLLAEQVEDQIYHYILDEALEPGAKLPNEFALGEKFPVGRSTIREAVKLLSSKGIVEVRQGSGTYVVTTVKGLSDPLNLRSVQDKNALAFDLVNVRLLLEPGIAEMAAQNATPEDIERLRRLCDRVETKIHEGDRYGERETMPYTRLLKLERYPHWKGKIEYIVTITRQYSDKTDVRELCEVFPGKERKKAFDLYNALLKQYPGIHNEMDTERRSWER